MDYQQTLDYLYSRLPVFQNIGARAFKPGLHTTRQLCSDLGDPQTKFATIHVGGTNGKGSTSHMLAAILQNAGYRVGLYTSPHLKDFRERIRVNGNCISEDYIVEFVDDIKSNIDRLSPSFFEVTVAMAFAYFGHQQVDIAIVEVGMGGRLDSTNIITPIVSVITNVSLDHTQFLGSTLPAIAGEKSGIIKPGVPAVISEYQDETAPVFEAKAKEENAPIFIASNLYSIKERGISDGLMEIECSRRDIINNSLTLRLDLTGTYQLKNVAGVLTAVDILKTQSWNILESHIKSALHQVVALTGLKGRWQLLNQSPRTYCDTAHNVGGLQETIKQFQSLDATNMHFVLGFVSDKDISSALALFPRNASYYFCAPGNMRALNAHELAAKAKEFQLVGQVFSDVNQALAAATDAAGPDDIIYVGGSTFVVADLDQL